MSMTNASLSTDDQNNANAQNKKKFFSRRNQMDASNESNATSSSSSNHVTDNGIKHQIDINQFEGDGVSFKGKLIGHEFVAESRGEKMCQESMKKLKILQRAINRHKRRVLIYVSFDGIKIRDAQTSELLFHHSVPQISFISRDETDSRAFGYVFGSSATGHQFIALRTEKMALPVMNAIGQLFSAALEKKRREQLAADADTVDTVNETHSRRESSITLRPPPSPSPNNLIVDQTPPESSANQSMKRLNSDDFFSSVEPIDSVFESDWQISKEKLEKMNSNGENADVFADSFGSLSISSGEMTNWANFEESSSGTGVGNNKNIFNDNTASPFTVDPFAQNDNVSSMSLANIKIETSPMPILPPIGGTGTKSRSSNSTSSADRYACFAEISSISSSIFDSLCDQFAEEENSSGISGILESKANTSRSLNNSLNGGVTIATHRTRRPDLTTQLSSSFNGSFKSFEPNAVNNNWPLNNSPFNTSKNEFIDGQNMFADPFASESRLSPPPASGMMYHNQKQLSSSMSNSPPVSDMPWSSSPPLHVPMNDPFASISTAPLFAELDPLAKNKPFVEKTQFFAEQRQPMKKHTLKELDPNLSANVSDDSVVPQSMSHSPLLANTSHSHSYSSLSRSSSSASSSSVAMNPFHSECIEQSQSHHTRVVSPFNPFTITSHTSCAFNHSDHSVVGSQCLTPPPPPRPPPRGDNCISPVVPLRRPPIVYERSRAVDHDDCDDYQHQRHVNQFDGRKYAESWDETRAPPLPNPQRKPTNRKAQSWDPFSNNDSPVVPSYPPPVPARPHKPVSTYSWPESQMPSHLPPIANRPHTIEYRNSNNCNNFNNEITNLKDTNNVHNETINHVTMTEVSPPERNIFLRNKTIDPFDDPFFADK